MSLPVRFSAKCQYLKYPGKPVEGGDKDFVGYLANHDVTNDTIQTLINNGWNSLCVIFFANDPDTTHEWLYCLTVNHWRI